MAKIAGVELPKNKRVEIGLTRIFGIGRSMSGKVLKEAGINPITRVKDLTTDNIVRLRSLLERDYKIEGDLRRETSLNIKRLMDIGCYKGGRHKTRLPVSGQRTKTNARTRKGPKKL